jgi:chemotaxis protein MotB
MESRFAEIAFMINENEEHKTEILIIRRHNGDEHGGHKGGAWKIAYADFVTAMMAFFLVMWLINSTNEATRSRVASYFNPIKMTDASPTNKGLLDAPAAKKTENKTKSDTSGDKPGQATDTKGAGDVDTAKTSAALVTDETLRDPYKMIEQISKEGQAHPSGKTVDVVSEKTGDPFDPKAWEVLREGKQNSEAANANDGLNPDVATPGNGAAAKMAADVSNQMAKDATQVADAASAKTSDSAVSGPDATPGQAAKTPAPTANDVVSQAEKDIRAAIADAGAEKDLQATVKETPEGLLIVLSDASTHPMYGIGSAKPTPALIEVVDTIGKILETQTGQVVIRGHTDARRYKSLNFDNWQLSTARAHMASYILMHGGLEEKRIERIEGYGSSDPLDPADPLADANRRVEFLLRK